MLRKYDMLFIADEVICGFGRTGNMFGLPDLRAAARHHDLAKALSSGLSADRRGADQPADLRRRSASNSDKIGIFGHGFTYSGHPVSAAVALETLKIYEERDIVGHVRRVGAAASRRHLGASPIIRWSARCAASA